MKKRCTQSSCRKIFNPKRCIKMSASLNEPDEFYVRCPYCGKEYRRFEFFSPKIIQSILSISKDLNVEPSMLKSALWQIYEMTRNSGFGFSDIISLLEDKNFRDMIIDDKNKAKACLALAKKTKLNSGNSIRLINILKKILES